MDLDESGRVSSRFFMGNAWIAYLLGLGIWAAVFLLSLKVGAESGLDMDLVMALRLPRAITATAVGLSLAVSGAVLQAVFANPLCEPYTLGVSAGAALGAVTGGALGLGWVVMGFTTSSFFGALAFALVINLIATRPEVAGVTVLLSGVMLGFLGSSAIALWMAMSNATGVQGALIWLLGDLSRARLHGSIFVLVGCLVLTVIVWTGSRDLDAFLVGEEAAAAIGIDVPVVRRRAIFLTSMLVALSVSAAGMIGFIGLVVPHVARRFVGPLHFKVIPLCGIWGASTLMAADCLARTIAGPYELPVGSVTALAGAPFFLWVLLRRSRGR